MKKRTLVIRSFPQQSILKIPNNFLRASYKCSATTQRMYFYSIFKYLTSPGGQNTVSFTFSDFFSDLNMSDGMKTRDLIKESANEILDMKIVLEDNDRQYVAANVFQSARCVFTETTFSFKFTEDMKVLLDELKEIGFSLFEINDLGKLKSFYALRYYLVALSYKGFKGRRGNDRGTWFFEYSVEDLRRLFDIQDGEYQQMGPFRRIVVDLPVRELNERGLGMRIECKPVKRGRRIVGFRFDCEDTGKVIPPGPGGECLPIPPPPEPGRQDDEVEYIISRNPSRYAEILEEERLSPSPLGLSPETQAVIRLKGETDGGGSEKA